MKETLEKLAQHVFSRLFIPLKDQKINRAFRGGIFISMDHLCGNANGAAWQKRWDIPPTTELGLILKNEEAILVKCISKSWYQIVVPDRNKDFFAPFLTPGLRRQLIVNTYKALKHIQTALRSSDTAKYENEELELSIIR